MTPKQKALVIDDEEITLTLLSELMKKDGFDVVSTTDAVNGIDLARNEKPDIIILDLYMPGRNGFSLLSQLRSDDAIGKTPVVMVTSENGGESVGLAFDLGVNNYVTKPIIPELLRKKVMEAMSSQD